MRKHPKWRTRQPLSAEENDDGVPIYEFTCELCSVFELSYAMGSVPDDVTCPTCHGFARRRISAPNLSSTGSAAFRLVDSTKRSAHEPQVVSTPSPGTRTGATQRFTSNPLHRKLPRS